MPYAISELEARLPPWTRELLACLTERQRAAFVLREAELTYDEISRTLAIPLGTVMSRLHRAKLALKNQIEALTLPEGAT